MAVVACVMGLARDTRGHDWYATGKLILAELLVGSDLFEQRGVNPQAEARVSTWTLDSDRLQRGHGRRRHRPT